MGRTTSASTQNSTQNSTQDPAVKKVFSCKLFIVTLWTSLYCTEIWVTIIGGSICTFLTLAAFYGSGFLYCLLSISFLPTCGVEIHSLIYYIGIGLMVLFCLTIIIVCIVLYICCLYSEFKITVGITLCIVLLFGVPLLLYELTDLCLSIELCREECNEDNESCRIPRYFWGYIFFGFIFWIIVTIAMIMIGVLVWECGKCLICWWKEHNNKFMVRVQQTPAAPAQNPPPILPIAIPTSRTAPISPTVPKSSFIQTDSECSICTNVMGKSNIKTLQCGHKFHNDCINDWFQRGGGCPYCRKSITTRN